MKSQIKFHAFPIFFFLLLSLLLVLSWFKGGYIYGGGDVGLQTYNPTRIQDIAKYIWWEAVAPGIPTPQGLTALPFNVSFSFLKIMGFTPLLLQATLFFMILILMGWGMYFLVLYLFGRGYRNYAVLAGLFYIFNPYMMISVWHRFVHGAFFLAASIPFLIIFWSKWIRNKDPAALLFFLIINTLALYAYGTIAYIVTVWLFLLLITTAELIFPWGGLEKFLKVGALFLLGLLFWMLTNCWWIIPIFKIAPAFLSEQHTSEQSLATLYTLGNQTILPYSLQLVNPFYLFSQLDFGQVYVNPFIKLLPWIFVSLIILGIIAGLLNQKTSRWSVIFLVVVILSKGVASPMGYFYVLGMKYFFPLGVIRNPFEKIGILLPVVSSILFAIGSKIFFDYLKNKYNIRVARFVVLICFVFIVSFCWPMITGQIFGKIEKPGYVEVPQSYQEADTWMKSRYSGDSRNPTKILHLPLTKGESISYGWGKGYSGLEPSALLFTAAPSISHGFNLKHLDNSIVGLYHIFHTNKLGDQDVILRALGDFNIEYIVLHTDVKWEGGEFYDPKLTEDILDKLTFLEPPQIFGALKIYKISDQYLESRVRFSADIDWLSLPDKTSLWPWRLSQHNALISDPNSRQKNIVELSPKRILVFPNKTFRYTEASSAATLFLINQLILDPNSESLWLAPLDNLKRIYRINNEVIGEQINDKLISASSELLKVLRGVINEKRADNELDHYYDLMKSIFNSNSAIISYYALDKAISNIFQVHLYMLRVISNKQPQNVSAKVVGDFLKRNLINKNFVSFSYIEGESTEDLEKTVFKFEVPEDSEYEILLDSQNQNLSQEKSKNPNATIDGKMYELSIQSEKDPPLLGKIFLNKGNHEFNLPVYYSDNLFTNFENNITKIKSEGNVIGFAENPIKYVTGGDVYQISFSAKVEVGNGFYIQLAQDTDTLDPNGKKTYQVNEFINQGANNEFVSYSFPLPTLRQTTKQALIRFLVVSPLESSALQNAVILKDLKIVRVMQEDIFLRKAFSDSKIIATPSSVEVIRESPVLYSGKIEIKEPGFVIFSESFHPGWKLILSKQGKDLIQSDHFLANLYANAWFVNEIGEYSFKLKFEPQDIVFYGLIIALASFLGLTFFSLGIGIKNYGKK